MLRKVSLRCWFCACAIWHRIAIWLYLTQRLLHLVVQVFDLLLQLFDVVQNLDSLFLYFLFQLHALQSL